MPGLLSALSSFTRANKGTRRHQFVKNKFFHNPERKQLISKWGNKNFYKGRGAPSPGIHLRGRYSIVPAKVELITFKCPDLTAFPLKPYVQNTTPPVPLSIVEPLIPRISKYGNYWSKADQQAYRTKPQRLRQRRRERAQTAADQMQGEESSSQAQATDTATTAATAQ